MSSEHKDATIHSLSFSADGGWLAAASHKRIDLWDARTLAPATTLLHEGALIGKAAFSPKGTKLAVVGDNPLTIWNVT